ncbi:MFS transporter [Thermodesulfatator autotrophicus]|uniref:Major facilitator superfamily (MFS) profile domain-containing protein n=1 Tax=Thermodesulfatator autotrophicus TaxID=1795632 RepID=A0A177E8F2_9BACT|nr:MFS transporter [Thermodesulfatator autotrophicus]OAG27502.1 hypothetical protein TH606_06735 [Thermodesulfatator autotrophicus]
MRKSLFLLCFLSACGAFAIATTAFFMPVYLKEIDFSGREIGILYAALSVTSIITSFPSGLASDRFLARDLIALALILMGIACWLKSEVFLFLPFVLAYLTYGVGQNLFRVSLDALLLKSFSQNVGKVYGYFNGARMLGFTLGGIIGGLLLSHFDFRLTLKLIGSFCVAISFIRRFLPQNIPVSFGLKTYKNDFFRPSVLFFAIWLFMFYLHWGAEFTSYGLFLRENLKLSLLAMGFYMSAEFAMVGLASVIMGLWLNKGANPYQVAFWGLLASGIGHMGMIIEHLPVSLTFRLIHGFGDGTIMVLSYVGIAKLFKIERIGGNSGLITLTIMLGGFIGSLVFGPLGEKWGYQWPLFISGVTTLVLIPMIFIPKVIELKHERRSA